MSGIRGTRAKQFIVVLEDGAIHHLQFQRHQISESSSEFRLAVAARSGEHQYKRLLPLQSEVAYRC